MNKMKCCPTECPKAGDVFVCDCCRMTVLIVRDCTCADGSECVSLACCGDAMCKVNKTKC